MYFLIISLNKISIETINFQNTHFMSNCPGKFSAHYSTTSLCISVINMGAAMVSRPPEQRIDSGPPSGPLSLIGPLESS